MQLNNLHDALIEQLAGLDRAEIQVLSELPTLTANAKNDEFREALDEHLRETHGHVRDLARIRRLDVALADLGVARPSEGPEPLQLSSEGGGKAGSAPGGPAALDLTLRDAAKRVEHYEIAAYATARALAAELGYPETISLLDETLTEERDPDSLLTRLTTGDFASRETNE